MSSQRTVGRQSVLDLQTQIYCLKGNYVPGNNHHQSIITITSFDWTETMKAQQAETSTLNET